MALISQFQLGTVVSFEVYGTSVLGNNFKNLEVLGIVDADSTRFFGTDVPSLHASIYSELPEGTPDNYSKYYYVRFKTQNDSTIILGLPWIKEESVSIVSSNTIIATIPNVGPDDVSRVQQALSANGFNGVTLTID